MAGFLREPLCAPLPIEHPFEPDDLLLSRFRIIREVAHGGMGVVYEAYDERLERRIAIKCAKSGYNRRLPPEVRHAREVAHPNVCKIFEIHTAYTVRGEVDFVTMEFLDGETLGERLKRGMVPESEARSIALQLCRGLAEAHRNRVVHGDLKSNNVILARDAEGTVRAVITDFGLARYQGTVLQSAQSGVAGGTPDYMAPELRKGEKATVASDIYALGVMLYELASGRRPFDGGLSLEEQLVRKPAPVNAAWDGVLGRCLDGEPGRRFRSAGDVALAIEGPLRRRQRLLTAAAAIVLCAMAAGIAYFQATRPEKQVTLAVLPFETDRVPAAVAGKLYSDVAATVGHLRGNSDTGLSLISPEDVRRRQVDTLDEAKTLLHATHVLRGTLKAEKDRFVLRAYLTDLNSGVNTKDWSAEYASGEPFNYPQVLPPGETRVRCL